MRGLVAAISMKAFYKQCLHVVNPCVPMSHSIFSVPVVVSGKITEA